MLNIGKKIRALRDKKKYSNSRVVRKKKILIETKNVYDSSTLCQNIMGCLKSCIEMSGYGKHLL